ncbi:hypothetical protein TCAL_06124 [Tigriopus californicus]|uniref:dolichyl-P-Man:Man5GlcNAc2-PP-dolichol alpha-1,3-mannosyltransferase n=1 Tax=Tigriopus californicus TaxID=6832 RepID=A0A553NX55_TIGCA|nr:lethal(2)neighbour of tid protein-like [Tigriopus californicus]TRY70011.1 hypothetical protein TCAL_06124 [Tigriopus californicus]|eukprot:TCALIF_06124-PA protein Name:"Similar to Alg3 Dol-P-Man:Man(5)GlcNAc(2)-PP-Dol alpha-1,3-mannosyltransferase (Mus musculus)" AED:0.01 eAED:0.01 QI:255/1/1/1/1/1/2/67/435
MAPGSRPQVRKRPTPGGLSGSLGWRGLISTWAAKAQALIMDPAQCAWMAGLLLGLEVVINALVIHHVKYTEIDWRAYMQEVEGVVNGTYNYAELKGDTGPLVYPAGFVWLYMGLYYATDLGLNVQRAQYIFAALYVVTLALVFRLMVKSEKVPPYVLVFMSVTSYRIHSIFVLRLFNDPVAMAFLYAALNFFISEWWSLGSVCFSLAVGVKMNILLFAPALFFAYLANLGVWHTAIQLFICGSIQVSLALPFLLSHPWHYLQGAFDLGRVFMFKWTVNWRFLPEEVFLDRRFHWALLGAHVLLLLICIPKWWKMLTSYRTLKAHEGPTYAVQLFLLPMFMSNFIGVALARSLHYQFYVWYFHQLHYLFWCVRMPSVLRLCLLGLIELCWNTYPSTIWSSGLLHSSHLLLLSGLLWSVYGMTKSQSRPSMERKKIN